MLVVGLVVAVVVVITALVKKRVAAATSVVCVVVDVLVVFSISVVIVVLPDVVSELVIFRVAGIFSNSPRFGSLLFLLFIDPVTGVMIAIAGVTILTGIAWIITVVR